MTGFSATTLVLFPPSGEPVNVAVSLKALNSRFFEVTAKLPGAVANFETDFLKLFKKRFHRGHIFFTVHASSQYFVECRVKPNIEIIRGYVAALEHVKEHCTLSGSLSIHDVIALPDAFIVEEHSIDDASRNLIFATVERLIDEVIEARKKEGLCLRSDLEQRAVAIEHDVDAIEHTFNTFMDEQKALVGEELENLEAVTESVAEARRQSLYLMLDKIDIHEEIVRLRSHLGSFVAQLGSPGTEKGKRLDFTLQELSREINTVAAKCSDGSIGGLAINVKVELEKAREQVQNIV